MRQRGSAIEMFLGDGCPALEILDPTASTSRCAVPTPMAVTITKLLSDSGLGSAFVVLARRGPVPALPGEAGLVLLTKRPDDSWHTALGLEPDVTDCVVLVAPTAPEPPIDIELAAEPSAMRLMHKAGAQSLVFMGCLCLKLELNSSLPIWGPTGRLTAQWLRPTLGKKQLLWVPEPGVFPLCAPFVYHGGFSLRVAVEKFCAENGTSLNLEPCMLAELIRLRLAFAADILVPGRAGPTAASEGYAAKMAYWPPDEQWLLQLMLPHLILGLLAAGDASDDEFGQYMAAEHAIQSTVFQYYGPVCPRSSQRDEYDYFFAGFRMLMYSIGPRERRRLGLSLGAWTEFMAQAVAPDGVHYMAMLMGAAVAALRAQAPKPAQTKVAGALAVFVRAQLALYGLSPVEWNDVE